MRAARQFVKDLLFRIAPRGATALVSARARHHSHELLRGWGNEAVARALLDRFGNQVQEGPFAGTVLAPMSQREQIGPFLLGVYESELDQAWETVCRGTYTQIIDVGAKFGYYAVGLARKYPRATVVAFDTDWWARKATREMAAANHTPNVVVRGFCSPEWLVREVEEAAFIISDCEGYEDALFSSTTVPALRSATLIVETHDVFVPGVRARIREAFGRSHAIRVIDNESSRRRTTRSLEFLSTEQRRLAEHEVRSPQVWLLCLPREGPNRDLSAGSSDSG